MRSASRVLVIGAAGLVGSAVAHALGARASTTFFSRVPAGGERLDVTDPDAIERTIDRARPAAVVLAAAETYVEKCEKDPAGTRLVNVDGTRFVQRAAARHGATLVVFSSEYVFDGEQGPYSEDDPIRPLNEYGRQKVAIESIARSGDHLVCRTSGVFGLDDRRANFVLQLVDALRTGRKFTVPSDQLITPTYAPALARAIVDLLDEGHRGTFHVCGPRILPRVEFARMAARAFGLASELIVPRATAELGLAASRPLNAGISDALLRRTLGRGLTDPEQALAQMASAA